MPSLSDGRPRAVISTNNCSGTLFSICAVSKEAANKVKALHMDKDKLKSLGRRPGRHKVTSDMLVDFKSKLRTVASETPKQTFGDIRKRVLPDRVAGSDAAKHNERGQIVKSASMPSSAENTDERPVRSFTRGKVKSTPMPSSAINTDKRNVRSTAPSSKSSLSIPTQSLSQSSSLSGHEAPQTGKPYLYSAQTSELAKVLKSMPLSAVNIDKRTVRPDTLSSMSSLGIPPTGSLSRGSSFSGHGTSQEHMPDLDSAKTSERAKVVKSTSMRSSAVKTDKRTVRSDTLSSMSSLSIPTGSLSRNSSFSGYEAPQTEKPYLYSPQPVERAKVLKSTSMPLSAVKTDKRTVRSDTLSSMSSLSIPTGSLSRNSSFSGLGIPQMQMPDLDSAKTNKRANVVKSTSVRSPAVETDKRTVRSATPSSVSSLSIPTGSLSRSSSFSGRGTPQKQMPYLRAMSICQKKIPVLSDGRNPTGLLTSLPTLLRYKSECLVDYVPKTRRSEVKVSHCINNI